MISKRFGVLTSACEISFSSAHSLMCSSGWPSCSKFDKFSELRQSICEVEEVWEVKFERFRRFNEV